MGVERVGEGEVVRGEGLELVKEGRRLDVLKRSQATSSEQASGNFSKRGGGGVSFSGVYKGGKCDLSLHYLRLSKCQGDEFLRDIAVPLVE